VTDHIPIRVALVITRLNVGGPAVQVLLLHERLDPARFDTLLITGTAGDHEGDLRDLRPSATGRTTSVPTLRREISPLADLRTLVTLIRTFRSFRPDIVHTNMAKAGLLGRVAAKIAGVPVIIHTYHGNVFRGYFDPFRSSAFLFLERSLGLITTRVITLSARQTTEIASRGVAQRSKIDEIPIGLDLRPFRDAKVGALRRELAVGTETPLVGIVARLVPIKAVHIFIEAAALIAADRPDARFVVVGDGPDRADLERLTRDLGLAERCAFLGWRADLPDIYADLDVVVLCSLNEGLPVSIIEAMAAGRSVVATAVGGVPDLVRDGETGSLVGPEDPAAIASAVVVLLADRDLRARYGEAAWARVHPKHETTTLISAITRLYEDLTARAYRHRRPFSRP
jgi:glycosyltransferase involved in cell wall biosynthesis